MFNLFSKNKKTGNFYYTLLKTDMHSHLLPGIDDGADDLETSMELIAGLKELGYKKLITTPHVLWDMYKNTPDTINAQLEEVQKEIHKRDIDIELTAAAEYFLDDHLAELLQKKERLLTLKDNLVLVEFSVMHMSMHMKEILFDVQMAGYRPVLAHPERYTYLFKNYDIFHELKHNGCLFQLNLLSLSGGYGKTVAEMAGYFLKNDFYSLVGTDMHHTGHLERMRNFRLPAELKALIQSGRLLNEQL